MTDGHVILGSSAYSSQKERPLCLVPQQGKKDDKHKATINNLMIKTIDKMKEKEGKVFYEGVREVYATLKTSLGYQSPIEFKFHLSGFWISSVSFIIVSSIVGLPVQSPSNNLAIIQLDGGYFPFVSSLLFTLQFLPRDSFFSPRFCKLLFQHAIGCFNCLLLLLVSNGLYFILCLFFSQAPSDFLWGIGFYITVVLPPLIPKLDLCCYNLSLPWRNI